MPSTTLTQNQWTQIYIGGSSTVDQQFQVTGGKALISLGTPSDATTAIDSAAFDDKLIYVPAATSVFARPNGVTGATITWGNFGSGQTAAGYELLTAGLPKALPTVGTTSTRLKLDKMRRAIAAAQVFNAEDAGIMSAPPAFTQGASADAALTKVYTTGSNLSRFTVRGGRLLVRTDLSRVYVATADVSGDTGNMSSSTGTTTPAVQPGDMALGPYYYSFMTDAPKLQVRLGAFTAGYPMRVLIDGQLASTTTWDFQSGGQYLTIDFSSLTPSRKARQIDLECQNVGPFFAILTDPLSRIWQPRPRQAVRVAWTGDSHLANNGGIVGRTYNGTTAVAARLLGIWDNRVVAVEGTGFIAKGGTGLRKTIFDQMDSWVYDGVYDMIVFGGGFNDTANASQVVAAAALACWQKARAAQPNALIVQLGVPGGRTGPSAGVIGTENGLLSAFAAWADPYSFAVPYSTDTEPAEFGTGQVGSTNGSGNSDLYVAASPEIHSSDAGHNYRGRRYANGIIQGIEALAAAA